MRIDQLSGKEFSDKFTAGMKDAETGRRNGLKKLEALQSVKERAQIKEHLRLQSKLGKDHPRVQNLESRLRFNQGLAKDLAVHIETSTIEAPRIDEENWMVHGRVMDAQRKAQPGLTIGIFDAEGRWVREAGHACTDERGYFAIATTPKKETSDQAQQEAHNFLHVMGPDTQLLHKDPEPLRQAPGRVEYREIFLGRGKADCRAPQNGGDDSDLPTCGQWVLRGKVTNPKGKPLPRMDVDVFYKMGQKPQELGSDRTKVSGDYEVIYTATDTQKGPAPGTELIVTVTDSNGEIVYTSKEKIVYIPGKEVEFDIRVDA